MGAGNAPKVFGRFSYSGLTGFAGAAGFLAAAGVAATLFFGACEHCKPAVRRQPNTAVSAVADANHPVSYC